MTVLTLPFTTAKSDKVPLFDNVDPLSPTQNNPKLLESNEQWAKGDNDDPNVVVARRLYLRRIIQFRLGMFILMGVLLVLASVLCAISTKNAMNKAHKYNCKDSISDASKPEKSYTSYAEAENDMKRMPSYDADQYQESEQFSSYKQIQDSENVITLMDQNFYIADPTDDKDETFIVSNTARFIHDFTVNVTGIVDIEGHRCFIIPLLRKTMSPPTSLYDLLFKMNSGYYSKDIKKEIANMRIVKPAIKDVSVFGTDISKDCAGRPTFKLEKRICKTSATDV